MPEKVRAKIAAKLVEAVTRATASFDNNASDEDSLTGALIGSMVDVVNGFVGDWSWRVRPMRIASNIVDGGEAAIGADFILQVDVYEGSANTAQKLVPVQAKKVWTGTDRLLAQQASTLADFPGSGIVADYDPRGYTAVRAEIAAEKFGDRRKIPKGKFKGLGEMLGEDFLQCLVGTRDGYINTSGTHVVLTTGTQKQRIRIRTEHVARLSVMRNVPAAPPTSSRAK